MLSRIATAAVGIGGSGDVGGNVGGNVAGTVGRVGPMMAAAALMSAPGASRGRLQ